MHTCGKETGNQCGWARLDCPACDAAIDADEKKPLERSMPKILSVTDEVIGDVPSAEAICDNCGAMQKHHGIDAVHNGPLMCPLYLKNDAANWDGNYHRWRKFKAKETHQSNASSKDA